MRRFFAWTLLVTSSFAGFAPPAVAEKLIVVATGNDGRTWQIDLDERSFFKDGLRAVIFYLSSTDDEYKHKAAAICGPYDIYSPDHGWEWTGRNLGVGTVGGEIARAACNWRY